MHVGALPGRSRGLQGPPKASRGGSRARPKNPYKNENAPCCVLPKPRSLGEAEISCGVVRHAKALGLQAALGNFSMSLGCLYLDPKSM